MAINEQVVEVAAQVIIHAGNARNLVNQALTNSNSGELNRAQELLDQAEKELSLAHQVQTDLIQAEAGGDGITMTLLIAHAQDTLMAAMVELNLGEHILMLYQRLINAGSI